MQQTIHPIIFTQHSLATKSFQSRSPSYSNNHTHLPPIHLSNISSPPPSHQQYPHPTFIPHPITLHPLYHSPPLPRPITSSQHQHNRHSPPSPISSQAKPIRSHTLPHPQKRITYINLPLHHSPPKKPHCLTNQFAFPQEGKVGKIVLTGRSHLFIYILYH